MNSRLFIEKIRSEEILRGDATSDDLAVVDNFSNEGRRCEVLAWRAILRRELGKQVEISYDEFGAPQVDTPNINISISHSKDAVAVLISERPCAIDIESLNRDFRRVASRYLSAREYEMAERYDLFAEMWSAKEALYKFYRKGGVDLICDIHLHDYFAENSCFTATICEGKMVVVKILREENLVVALID